MNSNGEKVAARARSLVGVRFRPQGRNPEHGVDCVGLVALAGNMPPQIVPRGYRMRSEVAEDILVLDHDEMVKTIPAGEAGSGDILLVQAGPGQHHFLVLVKGGFVHADAGIGRVVETPGTVAWPVLAAWRVTGEI